MTTALIADDEVHLAAWLAARLAAVWPELVIVATVHDGPAAVAALAQHAPDIAFLDIRMPGLTGLEVARHLGRTRAVFVTAYDEYAVEAFERDAVDYLLKPVNDERLARARERIERALAARAPAPDLNALIAQLSSQLGLAPRPAWLRWVRASKNGPDGELTQQIPVGDVLYFQADDKYTCVYERPAGAPMREWLIRTPLSELGAQLDPEQFTQIHRSVIVNLSAVEGTRRDAAGKVHVRIREHARELPVARQYVGLFRQM